MGVIKSAVQRGCGEKAHWKMSRTEIMARKYGGKDFSEQPVTINR